VVPPFHVFRPKFWIRFSFPGPTYWTTFIRSCNKSILWLLTILFFRWLKLRAVVPLTVKDSTEYLPPQLLFWERGHPISEKLFFFGIHRISNWNEFYNDEFLSSHFSLSRLLFQSNIISLRLNYYFNWTELQVKSVTHQPATSRHFTPNWTPNNWLLRNSTDSAYNISARTT
jgi:hypothetical protein